MKKTSPLISVIILAYNETALLAQVLSRVSRQKFDFGSYEIWVVDNSTDRKVERAVRPFCGESSNLQYVKTNENHLGKARALGVEQAQGEFVAFIDSDCMPDENWLSMLYQKFEKQNEAKDIAAFGSLNETPQNGQRLYRIIRIMSEHFVGHFNSAQMLRPKQDIEVRHLPTCNVLYRRSAILEVGNFSPQMAFVCEDVELNTRLKKAGYRLILTSDAPVEHRFSPDLKPWLRKMFRYGQGQCAVLSQQPEYFSPRLLLPPLFLVLSVGSILLSPLQPLTILFLPLYLFGLFLVSLWISSKVKDFSQVFSLTAVLFLTHIFYALGTVCGFFGSFLLAKKWVTS